MKSVKYIGILLCAWPGLAFAATLADCDLVSYDVTVNNGGQQYHRTISPWGGIIREYGPVISFSLPGHKPVYATIPEEEFCIWSGNVKVQRLNTVGDAAAGRR